ncbi:MAG: T9SS type A sorting domain-containing protein [Flavobacteriales bacterium]|nr:T9SS type A sorting domain-containing protein [Flavobacteriales bacterium]
MKKLLLLSAASILGISTLFASNYPCVIKSSGSWKISEFSSETGLFLNTNGVDLGATYSRNTFVQYPESDQFAYATFDGTSSTVHIRNASGGQSEFFRLNDRILSLDLLNSGNKLVYLATGKVPNYYDFLPQDVSITVLDLQANTSKKIILDNFSVFVDNLPFVGVSNRVDNRGLNLASNYAISSPTIIPELNEFMFVAKDIPGVTRLVRLNLNTYEVFTVVVSENVLSVSYCGNTNTIKALVFDKNTSTGESTYSLVDLNINNGYVSNKLALVNGTTQTTEKNGALTYDEDNKSIIVSKLIGSSNMVFVVDLEKNEVVKQSDVKMESDIYVPTKAVATVQRSLDVNVKMYPNPSQDQVTIETEGGYYAEKIVISDVTGKTVRSIEIDGKLKSCNIDVSEMIDGMYYITISSGDQNHVEKFIKL